MRAARFTNEPSRSAGLRRPMTEQREKRPADRLRRALPYGLLIPIAVLLGLAPFRPEPHLIEKIRMLFGGTLHRPIDIFDLALHGAPAVLLVTRVLADVMAAVRGGQPGAGHSP